MCVWGLVALLPASGMAQFQPAEESAPLRTEFSCLSWPDRLKEVLYVRTEGEYKPVDVQSLKRSSLIKYVGSNPVVFYRKGKDSEGNTVYSPAAQVEIGETLERPLLLFRNDGSGYAIGAMEDSFQKYPVGSYRFYNLTDMDLKARLGTRLIELEPHQRVALKQPFPGDEEIPVMFVVQEPDGLKPLYSNKWDHLSEYRYLILISEAESKRNGPIKFRILTDYPKR